MLLLFVMGGMLFSLVSPSVVDAKRLLPQVAAARKSVARSPVVVRRSRGITAKVGFRADRKALDITFSNLVVAKKVDYALTYKSKGKQEAVIGVVQPSEKDGATRELLFGTCSGGVCTYHTEITEAKLIITTTLSNGQKVIKPYRLKV